MGYSFISYSSKDIDRANELRDLLKSKNIDCWMARYDIEQNFVEEIGRRIAECSCFIVILSDSAQQSEWVSREIALAIKFKKTMFPIQIQKNLKLNYAFSTYFAIVHIEEVEKIADFDFGMSRILKKVEKIAGVGVPVEEKVETKAEPIKKIVAEPQKVEPVKDKAVEHAISKESDIVTVIDEIGFKYVGQLKNGKRHGKGTLYFPDGAKIYKGDWTDGNKHGKGIWYYPDGSIFYEGEFENGLPIDIEPFKNAVEPVKSEPIKEEFAEPIIKGESDIVTAFYKNGYKYVGQMKDSKPHGKGTLYRPDKSKWYEGDWIDGKRHGKGIDYGYKGSKNYDGDWVDGEWCGKGTWYWNDGSIIYDGEFENGEPKRK